jgi:hypothetical protein
MEEAKKTDLFGALLGKTDRAHSRKTDPWTSHAAARSMDEKLGPQHAKILDALADYGAMAPEQISDILGFPIWRRISELEEKGKVEVTGDTHKNRSGRKARKFTIVQ